MPNLLAEMHQFQAATCRFGRDVELNQGAEAHAVRMLQVGEVEDEPLRAGNELADLRGEELGDAGNELAVAVNGHHVVGALNVERDTGRRYRIGHAGTPWANWVVAGRNRVIVAHS